MSLNLYGQVEVYDKKEEVWKHAPLYKETENGEYKAVDLFRGGRMTVNAVMGKEFLTLNSLVRKKACMN